MNLKKISLDARELEHPEPMQRSMKILQELDETNYLYMLHRKNPIPLVDLAKENHFQIITQEDDNSLWHILITKNTQVNLSDLLDV